MPRQIDGSRASRFDSEAVQSDGAGTRHTWKVFRYDQQEITGDDGRLPISAGKSLKFVVEDPATGARSSTWIVKTGKNRDDIYLMECATSGEWKVSHHNDWGHWRIASTRENSEDGRKVLAQIPKMAPDQGWSEGIGLLFPCAYLRRSDAPLEPAVIRIPTSPLYSAVGVRLHFEEPGKNVLTRFDDSFGVGALFRASSHGGCVYVTASVHTLGSWQHKFLAERCANMRTYAESQGVAIDRFVGALSASDYLFMADLTVN